MLESPPILKVLIVFALILALGRLRVPLYLSLVFGGLAVNWWGGNSWPVVFNYFFRALADVNLWLLVAVTALVVEFGRELADKKNAEAIMAFARKLGGRSGRLWSLMLIPSLIGLVPMPAGALLSAPMVDQGTSENHWNPEWKAAVNYWFRHVWEYWWPIYPVVIIGLVVFKMETWRFTATMIAFTPAAFLIGYFWLLRPYRQKLAANEPVLSGSLRRFVILMWPVALVMVFVLGLPPVFAGILPRCDPQTTKLLAMLIGIMAGLVIVRFRAGKGTKMFASFFKLNNISILLTIGAILLFQSLLETSRLLPAAANEIGRSGLSVVLIASTLPFLAGFVTGVAAAIAGIAFPLVVGLLGSGAGGLTPMATLALSFGFGYMGMMLSPIHLCLIMTRDYFSASLLPIYRQLVLCVVSQVVFAILVFALLSALKL
jgi:integral membrane protein (TIGR00529 family)